MITINQQTALATALAKLDEPTAKTVHLTPQEARAVLRYLAAHGISAAWLARVWQGNARKRRTAVMEDE